MEYSFYLEQKFHDDGQWETRTLTAQEAEALGYKDGHKAHGEKYTLYVDGYVSQKAIQNYLDEAAATRASYAALQKSKGERGGER